MKHGKSDEMKIIIDTPVFDELAKYCKKNNIPLLEIPYNKFKTEEYKRMIDSFIKP